MLAMKIYLLSFAVLQALQVHGIMIAKPKDMAVPTDAELLQAVDPGAAPAPAAVAPTYTVAASPASADDDSEEDNESDADKVPSHSEEGECGPQEKRLRKVSQELAGNLKQQADLEKIVDHFGDQSVSDQEIDATARLVANETDSSAMANILARMWKEMRMFEYPTYAAWAKKEMLRLRHEEHGVEANLTKAQSDKHNCTEGKRKPREAESSEEESALSKELPKMAAGVAGAEDSKWNVWEMSVKQQKRVLLGSFVYLIGGVLCAFLYRHASARYPIHFLPELRTEKYPNFKDFSFHIFGCLEAPKLCILGCCCPCLVWADTLDRKGFLSFWRAFAAFFGLLLLHVYTLGLSSLFLVILGVVFRQKLRANYQIKKGTAGTIVLDVLAWCLCQPCAIIQEAREESIIHNDQISP